MIAYYIAQMSHVVRLCPYSNIQMSQVVKCVQHTNDRTNDHTNESLPIIEVNLNQFLILDVNTVHFNSKIGSNKTRS